MPQLLLLAVAGVAVWFGYKAVKKEMARVGKAVRQAGEKAGGKASERSEGETIKVVAELEQDPETGVYKPKE